MIDMQQILFMLVLIFPLTTSTQANAANERKNALLLVVDDENRYSDSRV